MPFSDAMSEMTKPPGNCRECEHAKDCKSWYGGTQCKYREAITAAPKERKE